MKRRRFLFVGGSSDPGGLHIHTADVAQALAALGHEVKILCVDRDFFTGLVQPDLVTVEAVEGFTMLKLRRAPKRSSLARAARWAALLARHPRHEIVLCRGAFGETPAAELIMAKLAGRRLYTAEHRPIEIEWPFMVSKRCYGAIMNRCVRRVIAVSAELAAIAHDEFGVAPDKIRVCLNWVDPIFRPPTPDERARARLRLGLADDVPVLGYLGRFGPEKRLGILIEAFKIYLGSRPASKAVLLLAGDGWYRDRVQAEALGSAFADRVRFVGWQTDPRDILHALDFFVLPSLIEGFPLSLIEAMATGLPCIAHPMSSTRQLIDSGRNGILADLSSADELCRQVAVLLDGEGSRRAEIGRLAAITVAETYSRSARLPSILNALEINMASLALPPPFPRALAYRPL